MATQRSIVGHLLQREQLAADLAQNNVAHAYLFSGAAHLGKMTVAKQFAFDLLSSSVEEEERAQCETSFQHLTHPDLLLMDMLWVEGVSDDWDDIAKSSNVPQRHREKKPPAKTDAISIDDIRALQERLHDTGTGRYRCCLIRSVERMQDAAANAFLKILEEPPEGLVFLLTTQAQGALLPTIVSRARLLPFRRVGIQDLRTLLEGVPEDDQAFILHISCGAPGMVVRLRNDPDLLRMHRTVHTKAQSFWNTHSLREQLSTLQPLSKRGAEANNLLLHLGLTLREQHPDIIQKQSDAFHALTRDLHTNAHRQLLVQRFALQIAQ